jgi:phosphate transport system substrate-binding protein
MKMNKFSVFLACMLAFFLASCGNDNNNGQSPDTPVKGKIKISVDESLKPLVDAEVKTFMQEYHDATITASYKPESEALNDMHMDTARAIVIPRELTKEELKYYEAKGLKVKMIKIAYDAIAIIENKENTDSTLTMARLSDILHGKVNNWMSMKGKNNNIQVVFDNAGSSTVDYIRNRFDIKNKVPENFYSVNSNDEVINYVEKTPGAIGFLGVNWLIGNDYKPNTFLGRIRVIALNPPDTAKNTEQAYYLPYQAWISNRYYPLVRDIYAITPEFFNGLGSGFITYMAGDKGQRIALHSGLVPATMPIRKIKIKSE